MAHKTRINGTYYGIKGGKCRVNGTNYSIKSGKTKVGGTNYSITFATVATFYMQDDLGSGKVRTYQFLTGMTIYDWVESEYNTDGWIVGEYDGSEVIMIPNNGDMPENYPYAIFFPEDAPGELVPGQTIEYLDMKEALQQTFTVIVPRVDGFNIYAYQTENIIVTAPLGITWAEIANAPSLNSYKTASGQTLKLVVSSADYPGVSIFASDGSAASFYHVNKFSSFVPQKGEQIDLSLLGGYASIDFDWSKWIIADL